MDFLLLAVLPVSTFNVYRKGELLCHYFILNVSWQELLVLTQYVCAQFNVMLMTEGGTLAAPTDGLVTDYKDCLAAIVCTTVQLENAQNAQEQSPCGRSSHGGERCRNYALRSCQP